MLYIIGSHGNKVCTVNVVFVGSSRTLHLEHSYISIIMLNIVICNVEGRSRSYGDTHPSTGMARASSAYKNHAGDWGILVGVWVDPDRYRRPGQCTNISLIIYFKMLCIYPLTIIV